MKNTLLLISFLLLVLTLKSQNQELVKPQQFKFLNLNNTQNTIKSYGDIIWEEDFNKEKWFNTVIVDDNGYLLDTTASLPQGWTFIDSTNNNFYWHWSDVGPRGKYTSGNDSDAFAPNNEILKKLPEETTLENGFMMLESDYFNTSPEGDMVDSIIDMNSYIEFGPIDFSDKYGVIFNCKIIERLCCNYYMVVNLDISSDFDIITGKGVWDSIDISTMTLTGPLNYAIDLHLNVSDLTAGHDSVYFRIGKKFASHYFVIIDDIKFYEPPTHNLEIKDGWADYIFDAEDSLYTVSNYKTFNFWGGYTEIPQIVVSNFVKFRAAVYNYATEDAVNSKLNVDIFKDNVLEYSILSEPKLILKMEEDTLRVFTDYTPSDVGSYQVSMTIVQDADDEIPNNNSWGYEFKVTDSNCYSRVRHGMEESFSYASSRDWASGGVDGDICAQMFYIPESTVDISVKGISVYIDDYTERPNEITAIENSEFKFIARLYKKSDNDSITYTGIYSEPYTLKISDTATWVNVNFVDNANLLIDDGLYYAGIEIYTGDVDYRFQIGDDNRGLKQQNDGGSIYLVSAKKWFNTGDKYAIDLILDLGVGISETDKSDIKKVSIHPNPFNGNLTVSNLDAATQILVSNVLGQRVMTIDVTDKSMTINTENLEKGVYLITINDEDGHLKTKKIIKK